MEYEAKRVRSGQEREQHSRSPGAMHSSFFSAARAVVSQGVGMHCTCESVLRAYGKYACVRMHEILGLVQ